MALSITLVQPRHIYAPDPSVKEIGHVYMPTSLLTVHATLLHSCIDSVLIDQNVSTSPSITNDVVGFNLLGAPYIPVVIELINKVRSENSQSKILLGGQVMDGFDTLQIKNLFGDHVYNGNNFSQIEKVLNLKSAPLKPAESIYLVKAYDSISSEILKDYLSSEISFYLSQGCKFSCTFCAANRTRFDVENNVTIRVNERYRESECVFNDLRYLLQKCADFNIPELSLYLSNLDLFQSVKPLHQFSIGVQEVMKDFNKVTLKMRGLATVRSFLHLHRKNSDTLREIKKAGLYQIGFGIDGATYDVYKATKKPQTIEDCLNAIRLLNTNYNITPETLMVFGHNQKEDEEALGKAFDFSQEMHLEYGAIPRPHVAKDIVPGNDGWYDSSNSEKVNMFLNSPWLFQNMDFTALPSEYTHPDDNFRMLVEKVFVKICELPNSLTQYVKPYSSTPEEEKIMFNQEKYDI